jgi:hypothetical protein
VAITALLLSNKRIDRVEAAIDRLNGRFDSMDSRFELLTGALHDIGKRLSVIEDRVGR